MKLRAYAKINPVLDVASRQSDGYHIIDSVFQSVSLFDEVEIEKSDKLSVLCDNNTICGDGNIAFAAASSFFEFTSIKGGANIKIKKNIPLAAGLGGGSADAAAVIRGLDEIYNTNLSNKSLMKIGLKVGADVPFCIVGGTKRVGGIGEILSDVPPLENCFFVLLKEGEKLSTKDMYKKIDAENPPHPNTEAFVSALGGGDIKKTASLMENSFEAVCDITDKKEYFKNTKALNVCLSGSGPTVFAVFETEGDAKEALNILKGKNAYLCHPVKVGVE